MDSSTLQEFRRDLYRCFGRAGDALMNTADALLTETSAHSLVELSLSPFFVRGWPSLYEAFQDAQIDRQRLRRLFATALPAPPAPERLVLGVDASPIHRPSAACSRDRSYVHAANLPEGTKPVRAGWQFSMLALLPEPVSSWTYVLDNQRIQSHQTAIEVAAEQLREVVPQLPGRALLEGDGSYGNFSFLLATEGIACDLLVRLAKNRVLYRDAPPKTKSRGAPKKDGAPFKCGEASTHGPPDLAWEGTDPNGQKVEVACWQGLHFKKARHIRVTLIRVIRHGAKESKRDPKVSWFIHVGEDLPPPEQIPPLYARRYSLEHGFRVDKQDLLWDKPRLRTPEQIQHWSDMVACVRNQLFLARPLAKALCQPWESKARTPTLQQVRRAMGTILVRLGTPALLPQPRGKSPGPQKGRIVQKAQRFPVIFKGKNKRPKKQKGRRKAPTEVV